jgi:hypothetical protein
VSSIPIRSSASTSFRPPSSSVAAAVMSGNT